jgi:uncharacterized protein
VDDFSRKVSGLNSDVLIMMTKAPTLGKVKTRLARDVGDHAAARVQASFIADLGERFVGHEFGAWVSCSPGTDHQSFEELQGRGWALSEQGEGTLGVRLQRALSRAFRDGASRVVFIGSDSPTLPIELVRAAFDELQRTDVVIGPVFDGGYYLIGSAVETPPIFEGIDWGTPTVFSSTIARLRDSSHRFSVLPYWYDVDDLADLRILADHLGLDGPYGRFEAPVTQRVLSDIDL